MPRRAARPALADQNAAKGGIGTLDRALSLLGAFTLAQPVLTLAALAEETQISKSTVLRMLASLEHAHLVLRLPDGRYALGCEIERLHHVLSASFSLESVVRPVLQSLANATSESATFYVPRGESRLCLYRIESPRPVRDNLRPGDQLPMDRGVGGRVLRAYLGGQDELSRRIRHEQVVALVGDREPELAGIGAPVFDARGSLVGAVTLTMPSTRFDQSLAPAVLKAGRQITAGLAGRYPDPE